jgi:release factor glutamine methyltransferase
MTSSGGVVPPIACDVTPSFRRAQAVGAMRRALAGEFADAGLDQADADARVLLQFALGLDRAGLINAADRDLAMGEREVIAELAARRLRHEPVAYIVGESALVS